MKTKKIDLIPGRCKQTVYPNDRWGAFHPHQCSFKEVKDGYCKIHHPDAVEKRNAEKEKRELAKRKKDPFYQLREALIRIEELKTLNKSFLQEIEKLKEENKELRRKLSK